jgi:very-short-patch-repair endonuclease
VATSAWSTLRVLQVRRQRPIDAYVVDFVCLECSLVVELDGGQHAEQTKARDERRDAVLQRAGYRVLRFWNNEVMENLEGVLMTIDSALRTGPHPTPLPQAGEGAGRRLAARQRDMRKARLAAARVSSTP